MDDINVILPSRRFEIPSTPHTSRRFVSPAIVNHYQRLDSSRLEDEHDIHLFWRAELPVAKTYNPCIHQFPCFSSFQESTIPSLTSPHRVVQQEC